ncbi:zinc finger, CCHC-type containing protein [Tanacetum coccineum]
MLVVWERGLRTNPKTKVDAIAWWIDSGATTYVCKDRYWFKTYEPVEDESNLYMMIISLLFMEKEVWLWNLVQENHITLFNVLYVSKLHKNLISGPVLNKCGYKQVYESNKYIFLKSSVFVGFGYYNNGMFMLNLNKVLDDSGWFLCLLLLFVNSSLWHARLGHVHYKRMFEMSKDDLIPVIDENPKNVTTCILTKITRQPFKSITRKSIILDLIHSDFCDCHATPSLGLRLVIQDFRQKEGIDYFDTYAPVTQKEVYMKQLEGFVMPGNEHKVCKLVKSLYGLKQAPKQWHQKLDEVVLSSGFLLNQSDKCVYSKFDDSDKAVEFENASITKDDMRKVYAECNDISEEKRALIDIYLKEESDKHYEMYNALFRKTEKLEKQINNKVVWMDLENK